jgi:hypothetical protein
VHTRSSTRELHVHHCAMCARVSVERMFRALHLTGETKVVLAGLGGRTSLQWFVGWSYKYMLRNERILIDVGVESTPQRAPGEKVFAVCRPVVSAA